MAFKHPTLTPPRSGMACTEYATEADSEDFLAGNLIYLDTSGDATECGAATKIAGLALKPGTNVTADHSEIPFEAIEPGMEIQLDLCDTTDAAKAASAFVKGEAYGLKVVSNVHVANFSDTSNATLIFKREVQDLGGGTSYRGVFTVADAKLQGHVG